VRDGRTRVRSTEWRRSPVGLYDCRCMITGVSLKGADATLVLLQQLAGQYVPLALAIKGNYNRLGSIDGIDEDANTRLVLQYFLESLRSGAFIVDEEYVRGHRCFPIRTIEALLQGFERNMNDGAGRAILNGQSVVFALIARAVWDTITQAAPPSIESVQTLSKRLFGASPVGSGIYAASLGAVPGQISELAAVDWFLTSRGLLWQPSEATGQDHPEEMRQYLDEARRAFSDSPTILAALRGYEHEVGDLLKDA
jgi:hypothetical protein